MQSFLSGAVRVRPGAGCRRCGVKRCVLAASSTACAHPAPRRASSASPSYDSAAALRRREALLLSGAALCSGFAPAPALAARGRIKPPPSDQFLTLPSFEWRGATHEGLRYADLVVGTGREVVEGAVLSVQYDCRYRGIVAVSSREGRLLGGNRTLAEAFGFKYGSIPDEFTKPKKRKTIVGVGISLTPCAPGSPDEGLFVVSDTTAGGPAASGGVRPLDRVLAVDGKPSGELSLGEVARMLSGGSVGSTVVLKLRKASQVEPVDVSLTRAAIAVKPSSTSSSFDGPAGGLFAGTSGPKPPPALWLAMQGMREGGRRTVEVPSDVGYEDVGNNEIPPDASFTLDIELLSVKTASS